MSNGKRFKVSRRLFLKQGFTGIAATGASYLASRPEALAGFYNMGAFWKKKGANTATVRITQVFVQAATTGGTGETRVTQLFAQAATTGGLGETRITQVFAQAAATGGTGETRITQVFVQVAVKP